MAIRPVNVWRAGNMQGARVLAKSAPPRAVIGKGLSHAQLAHLALREALNQTTLLPTQIDRFLVVSDRQVTQPMPAFAVVLQNGIGAGAWGSSTLDIHTRNRLGEADAAEIAARYIRGGLSKVVAVVTVNTGRDSVLAQILAHDPSAKVGSPFAHAGLAESAVYFPGAPITNEMIAAQLRERGVTVAPDFYNGVIRDRVGIETRHFAAEGETVSDMAVVAIMKLVQSGAIQLEKVRAIVACSSNMDGATNRVEDSGNVPVGDEIVAKLIASGLNSETETVHVSAACASGAAGLEYGGLLHRVGESVGIGPDGLVVVVASEIYSRILDPRPLGSSAPNFVFGDGAGVYVLRRTKEGFGILATNHVGDGSQQGVIEVANGDYFRMAGPLVNAFGRRVVPRVIDGVHDALGIRLGELDGDVFAPHNANRETMLGALRDTRTVVQDKPEIVAENLRRRGNTSGSSVFSASHEHRDGRPVPAGARTTFVGFGAGMQVAAVTTRAGGFLE